MVRHRRSPAVSHAGQAQCLFLTWCRPSTPAAVPFGVRRSRRPVTPRCAESLTKCAWCYRFPPRVTTWQARTYLQAEKKVRDVAWRAQVRLCARYRKIPPGRNPPDDLNVIVEIPRATSRSNTSSTRSRARSLSIASSTPRCSTRVITVLCRRRWPKMAIRSTC